MNAAGLAPAVIREFVRDPVRAVPGSLARSLGPCRITLLARFRSPRMASRWTDAPPALDIEIATAEREPHDFAIEILVCLGQALWSRISARERNAFLELLRREMDAGAGGEIDEDSFARKRSLLSGGGRDHRRLERYCAASFSATCAEYVHALWHDVTVREGAGHLPAEWLRRRLELFAACFPPDRGYKLFPEIR